MTKTRKYEIIDSVQKLEAAVVRVREAQKIYAGYTQEQVDRIFFEAAMAANRERIRLAKMAVEETGMGVVEDKVIKTITHLNIFTMLIKMCRHAESSKRIRHAASKGIAEPVGILAAVIPTTNPTPQRYSRYSWL